jgi:uncharacterized protein (TIGR00251 family)
LPPGSVSMKEATTTLKVNLQPRASRNGIDGVQGDALKLRVTAPPVEGRANKALKKLLAEHLGIPPSRIAIISGRRSREKLVQLSGISRAELEKALGVSLPAP